jgi:transcriptional regulator with XRE-family HTH domain
MEKKLASTVGEAARLARMRAGLTQSDVAARIGVAPEVYGRMERGKMLPSVPTLLRMCMALRTNPDELMGISPRHGESLYAEDVPSDLDDTPDMRRLLRSLRRLQRPQIRLMHLVASAIVH